MAAEDLLETRLAQALHSRLDPTFGPHPRWLGAPVAGRVELTDAPAELPAIPRRTVRSVPWLMAAVAAVAVVVGGLLLLLGPGAGQPAGSSPSPTSSPAPTARRSGGLGVGAEGPFIYGTAPDLPPPITAADDGSVWLRDGDGNAVRFDPVTERVTTVVPMGHGTGAITSMAESIFATGSEGGRVLIRRIDPTTGAVLMTTPYHLGDTAADVIGSTVDQVWALTTGNDWITRLRHSGAATAEDFGTSAFDSRLIRSLVGTGSGPADAAFWAAQPSADSLVRIPEEVPKQAIGFGGCGSAGLAVADGALWTICGQDLARLDLRTGERLATDALPALGNPPHAIAVGGGFVWVASGNAVLQLDPSSGREVAEHVLPGPVWPVFASGKLVVADKHGAVWVISPSAR